MKMTNNEIYETAKALLEVFKDQDQRLPITLGFYIQKNKKILVELARDIEEARIKIISQYGKLNEDGQTYSIPQDNSSKIMNAMEELLQIEQEVQIYTIKISTLPSSLNLTTGQMEALMFMFEE